MTKRFLLINPNTTAAMTERVAAAARRLAPDAEFVPVTGRFGARYIASRASYAIAGHAALDAWASAPGPFDAVILACFGDPGLDALRELSDKPVIGMADASLRVALQSAESVSIVTGGERWKAMLQEFVERQGLAPRLASIRTVAPTGGSIANSPDAAVPLLREACTRCIEDGAQAVILGGAGLIGLHARLQPYFDVPIIDNLEATVTAALELTDRDAGTVSRPEAVESIGISPALSDILAHKGNCP